jgi:hypothetical protein
MWCYFLHRPADCRCFCNQKEGRRFAEGNINNLTIRTSRPPPLCCVMFPPRASPNTTGTFAIRTTTNGAEMHDSQSVVSSTAPVSQKLQVLLRLQNEAQGRLYGTPKRHCGHRTTRTLRVRTDLSAPLVSYCIVWYFFKRLVSHMLFHAPTP